MKFNKPSFKEAINEAEPILKEHHGYKQICMDTLNVILTTITLKFLWSENWRFFETKTATMEFVENFQGYTRDLSKC